MTKVAIIIPTYNEMNNIEKLINKINYQLNKVIIFIIDDSPKPEIKEVCKRYKNTKYFHRKEKKGRGSAVLFGVKKALKYKKFNLIIEMDADFSHDPKELRSKN